MTQLHSAHVNNVISAILGWKNPNEERNAVLANLQDTYGHNIGDELVRGLAQYGRQSLAMYQQEGTINGFYAIWDVCNVLVQASMFQAHNASRRGVTRIAADVAKSFWNDLAGEDDLVVDAGAFARTATTETHASAEELLYAQDGTDGHRERGMVEYDEDKEPEAVIFTAGQLAGQTQELYDVLYPIAQRAQALLTKQAAGTPALSFYTRINARGTRTFCESMAEASLMLSANDDQRDMERKDSMRVFMGLKLSKHAPAAA